MRQGELCGLPWTEVDLDDGQTAVGTEIVLVGWQPVELDPKSDAGKRGVALDQFTIAIVRAHHFRQTAERLAWGQAWIDGGKVFTHEDGTPLHPGEITGLFQRLAFKAGLPPVRFHDVRHVHASNALLAGVDVKVVQERLGHAGETITRDTYTTVLDEVARDAAERTADVV